MIFLENERVLLRPVTESDLDGAYAIWINSQDTDRFTEHAQFPHSREELSEYFERRNRARNDGIWLAIVDKDSGNHVGNIELSEIDWVHRKARFSILVGDQDSRGKGNGFQASKLLLDHAFRKLNLNRVGLGVHEENTVARKLYARLGFKEEGTLRQAFLRDGLYSSMIVMGLLADEFLELHAHPGP